uniref:Uncharacterized protein n=1 Tax=Acrobeloides nanus TaxID=290746 RepID=A0A914EEG7_9BILA
MVIEEISCLGGCKLKVFSLINNQWKGSFSIAKNIIAKINEAKKNEAMKREESDDSSALSCDETDMAESKMEYLPSDSDDKIDVKKEIKGESKDDDESE